MDEHADAKDSNEDRVGYQAGLVLEDTPFDAACFESALAPASLLRFVGGHCLRKARRSIWGTFGRGSCSTVEWTLGDERLIDVLVLCR